MCQKAIKWLNLGAKIWKEESILAFMGPGIGHTVSLIGYQYYYKSFGFSCRSRSEVEN